MKSLDGAAGRHFLVTRNDELYEAFPDLVLLDDGTVLCLYRESDAHAPAWSRVALIESGDRGRSWHRHRIVLDAPSRPNWNLPRISALRDGRLVVIGDRGYDNFLIWSADRGRTWSAPQPTPIRGQCPDQVVELDDGTLLVTVEREKPGSTARCFRPPLLHLVQYCSEDGGATWREDGVIWDTDVLGGSGEGATVQLPDGSLVCHIRNSNGYSHPSPKIFSKDRGRTWSAPVLSGTYGGMHRCGLLQDGRMLATYRQMSGNSSLYAWCGDPCEPGAYRVSSRWGNDGCATMTPEGLRIRCTGAPDEVPPAYFLPPPEHRDSVVTIEAELRCLSNEARAGWKHTCAINVTDAGELVFFPDRIEIGGQPDTVRRLDASRWHRYRVVRDAASLTVSVDGDPVIRSERLTRTGGRRFGQWGEDRSAFGTTFRAAQHMADEWAGSVWRWDNFARRGFAGESIWRSVSVEVRNATTPDMTWSWDAAGGEYPDQYQRDTMVEVDWDPIADFGGSSWVQFPDGEIICVYYTAEETRHQRPYLKGCRLHPTDFRPEVAS